MQIKIKTILLLLLTTAIITIANPTQAQNILDKKISLVCKKESLKEILKKISEQSGLMFSYNNQTIDENIKLDIIVKNKSANDILQQIGGLVGFSFYNVEKQIIIKPTKKIVDPQQPSNQSTKKNIVSGYIHDNTTKEALIGATVSLEGQNIGTITNAIGYYSLPLKNGQYTLVVSYLGYKRHYININITNNITINCNLEPIESNLEAIAINSDENKHSIKEILLKNSSLSKLDFSRFSGLILGGDLVGILSTDHGISRTSDGSAFYSVRGGGKDQNLVMIDDAPIYHPSHLFGFYSTIAPDVINSIDVYPCDFPLKYGGRLSSVIDIKTKDASSGKYILGTEISPFTTSNIIEMPIYKDKITFTANVRASNIKWIANRLDFEGKNKFEDFHAKIHFKISNKDRLYISIFHGRDYYSNLHVDNNYTVTWKNLAATIRQYKIIASKLVINNIFYTGNYSYNLFTSENKTSYWNTKIRNLSFKSDYSLNLSSNHTARAGFEYSYHFFEPATRFIENERNTRGVATGNATNIIAYIGLESKINSKLAAKAGVRLSKWINYGPATYFNYSTQRLVWDTIRIKQGKFNTFYNIEPRASIAYAPTKQIHMKATAERNIQYLHQLSNSISPFTTLDLWIPSNKYFKPQTVINITYTITNNLNIITLTGCAFYKFYTNLTEYTEHANMLLNPIIEEEFYLGKATTYGFEGAIEKTFGTIILKANYSYSHSRRLTPSLFSKKYIADNDIPHTINAMAQYKATKQLTIKANWTYNSGIPYTKPIGFYYYQNRKIPYYDERNNARLPIFHKLNLAIEYNFKRPWNKYLNHSAILSVYNVYNRTNYIMVSYNKIINEDGEYIIPTNYIKDIQFQSTGLSMPGIFPMLTYKLTLTYSPKERIN